MANPRVVMVAMLVAVVTVAYASTVIVSAQKAEPIKEWDECLINITPKCALDIIEDVFGNGTVDNQCCSQLVKEGRVCHDTLIKYIAERPSFRSGEPNYLKRSEDVWNQCVSMAPAA